MYYNRLEMFSVKSLPSCVMAFAVVFLGTVVGECEFPRQWWGRWHQTGVGELTIRANEISTKGTCYQQYRDYFFVENRREHCHQCMMIVRRHSNIIQYQESYCIGREALQSICGQMRVDGFGVVHTLVRSNASPSLCPFQKAFHFTYNNQSGGYCRSPTSYVHQCSTGTMLKLHFRQCRHCTHTSENVVEFECLATWKDGTDHFVYGLFTGSTFNNRDESYRCFMYQKAGSVVYIALSQDASCRGVRSPKEGPLVMELTEDVYGWPSARCSFPPSLASTAWIDAASTGLAFTFSDAGDTYALHSPPPKTDFVLAHARSVVKCLKTIVGRHNNVTTTTTTTTSSPTVVVASNNVTGDAIVDAANLTILVHTLELCQSLHRCLRIQRIHRSIVNIYSGSYVRDSKELCTDEHFTSENTQRSLLISASLATGVRDGHRCPAKNGRYLESKTTGKCQVELRIGCAQQDLMEIVSRCQTDQSTVQLHCLVSWREQGSALLVAKTIDSNDTKCFQFQRQGVRLLVTVSEQCAFGDGSYTAINGEYEFQSIRKNCHGNENVDDDVIEELSGVQQDVDNSDVIVAPTWHLSDRTPSKRVEESSPRVSNQSNSVKTSPTRTRKRLTIIVTALLLVIFCRTTNMNS